MKKEMQKGRSWAKTHLFLGQPYQERPTKTQMLKNKVKVYSERNPAGKPVDHPPFKSAREKQPKRWYFEVTNIRTLRVFASL